MKIQELAIIFILIILPISLILSAYTQFQIQTVNTQTQYDKQLTAATYDAIKAYQINAENSTTSELANSKIRDIEASVSTFKNSIMSAFRLNGYTEEDMNNYIPALVYTMYDGFYIYSPFNNNVDGNGNIIKDNVESVYGLKPYIPYSCRYKKGNTIDIVITYSLDNYITIQGMIDGEYVNESGYLIDGIEITSSGDVKYNGVKIEQEELKEYLPVPNPETNTIPETYSYVKINGTKYYDRGDAIIYLLNGTVTVQCSKTDKYPNDEYGMYQRMIKNNNQAKQYYKEAKEFTDKVINTLRLQNLTYSDAYDVSGDTQLWPENATKIFEDNKNNIENELSNFNQHRLEVIRNVIETNLSTAIANYNNYSKSTTNDFQMPKLKEDEWDYITHNISLISFLQGLNIGGKVYNGYTIVTNSESKEVVLENNIYILGNDGDYHRIGDKTLEAGDSIYGNKISAGRLNLDFKRKIITNNSKSLYYYSLKDYDASYTSIVMQEKVDAYDDIYKYVNEKCADDVKKAFYTALGRERRSQYNTRNDINIEQNIDIITITLKANGGKFLDGTEEKIITVYAGEAIGIDINPNRSGYASKGWGTSPNSSSVKYTSLRNIVPTSDMTLYYIWGKSGPSIAQNSYLFRNKIRG